MSMAVRSTARGERRAQDRAQLDGLSGVIGSAVELAEVVDALVVDRDPQGGVRGEQLRSVQLARAAEPARWPR